VGNGDCLLVQGTNDRGLLLDCGTVKKCHADDPGRVIGAISATLSGSPYYMLASHYHADHIGYLDDAIATLGQPLIAFNRGGTDASTTFDNYLAAITRIGVTNRFRQMLMVNDGCRCWGRSNLFWRSPR
jgi:glyoxylase-like metal-dependent hydrolase (beta-lactamase superfamily II)